MRIFHPNCSLYSAWRGPAAIFVGIHFDHRPNRLYYPRMNSLIKYRINVTANTKLNSEKSATKIAATAHTLTIAFCVTWFTPFFSSHSLACAFLYSFRIELHHYKLFFGIDFVLQLQSFQTRIFYYFLWKLISFSFTYVRNSGTYDNFCITSLVFFGIFFDHSWMGIYLFM